MKNLLYILILIPLALVGQENDPCYSVNEVFTQMDVDNPQIEINLVSGWNMIGYPCTQEIIVSDAFSSIVDKVIIVKDNSGAVYLPEWGFNGIGFLEGGQGYQIKITEFILGFTFCESIQFPTIEGCTDCEAVNFSKLATTDDGSCNYDSDGDGVPDSEEVVGCQDSLACDYDETATDSGECYYAQEGYDCYGTLDVQVGDIAFGGIVFYYDEIEQKGLVVSIQDIGQFEWGCYNVNVNGADNTSIGTGFINTNEITDENCLLMTPQFENMSAIDAVNYYESEGYNDWYLPSKEELRIICNNIGQCSINNNLGGFSDTYISSSEFDATRYIAIDFNNQANSIYELKNSYGNVRPIRAFGNWIQGCTNEFACNYNDLANMSDTSCEQPQSGYHCDGTPIQIGDFYQGGIVFYIDESGEHGIICSFNELGYFKWASSECYSAYPNQFSTNAGLFTADENTTNILNSSFCLEEGYASFEAYTYEYGDYNDWYLPSKDEISEICSSIGYYVIEGESLQIENSWFYWSSTYYNNGSAYYSGHNYNGCVDDYFNIGYNLHMRPIRYF